MGANRGSLSIIIPVFNQAATIGETLIALEEALSRTSFAADIVVVDDGSTDGTASAARLACTQSPLVILEQQNAGRFEARQRGLEQAKGHYCLLLDSRVLLEPNSLRFVEEQLRGGEGKEVWNGHVEIAGDGGPFAVFWDIITRRVFSAYFGAPRTTSYGLANFERFPKGTGCFFAPRRILNEAFAAFRSGYVDLRHANDDTPIIRSIAAQQPINISPHFSCRYASRTRLEPFVRHAFHRGVVFVDGHGRRESAWFPAVISLYAGSAGCIILAYRWRSIIPASLALAGAAGAGLALLERRPRDLLTMAWVTPIYATAHIAGMWQGLGMRLRARIALRPIQRQRSAGATSADDPGWRSIGESR